MRKSLAVLFFCSLLCAFANGGIIADGAALTLQECVDITLQNNPAIAAANNNTQAQRYRLWQSRADYMPTVSASGSYSYSDSENANGFIGADSSYSSSLTASQLIYSFGKTSKTVSAQKKSYQAAVEDSKTTTNNIIYNLKQAYYGAVSAKESRDVYKQSVEQYEEQLKRAQAFYQVGTRPKIDVTTAEVNLNNAKLNLIKAENALLVAHHKLLNIMGVYEEKPNFSLTSSDSIPQFEISSEEALEQAMQNRPDLASYRLKVESAQLNVHIARTGFAPELKANASYGWSGGDFPLYDRWSVGGGINIPIFNGFSTYNKVEEAKTNLLGAYINLTSVEQNILLEIKTAYLNFNDALSRIPVADLSREQAQENYRLAVGRYTVGVGNYIEVKDAEVTLSNAKLSYISAVLDYNLAIADLKKVMGTY